MEREIWRYGEVATVTLNNFISLAVECKMSVQTSSTSQAFLKEYIMQEILRKRNSFTSNSVTFQDCIAERI